MKKKAAPEKKYLLRDPDIIELDNVLEIDKLCSGYGKAKIVNNVSFSVKPHERWAVIGKNGTGKSTLIKSVAGLIPIISGSIRINGRSLSEYRSKEVASWISYVPQSQGRSIPFTVFDYVMLGRYANFGFLGNPGPEDRKIVEESLVLTDLQDYAHRSVFTLSGGEEQRVFLAGAVAQQAKIMLLDEPTTYLDPYHESHFYSILKKIHDTQKITVISVTHNINDALYYYTHILALKDGTVFYSGTKDTFLKQSPHILQEIFGIAFHRLSDNQTGRKVFTTIL
ncbi:MAG: ABC transporter ATP-binding protein [Chitinispirillia bacterium]|jgi:iron complex transport system ATP-binding protein